MSIILSQAVRSRLSPIVLFTMTLSAQGATIYVDSDASFPFATGASWCAAFRDLQDALAAAQPGDEIRVADGLYKPDRATGDRMATFTLKSGVSLRGGYAGCGAPDPDARDYDLYPAVLDGDLADDDGPDFANYAENSHHVVTYDDPTATDVLIEGFTVTSGNADGPDGLTNQGGGIHIRQGLAKCLPGGPTIRDCVVEKNWGEHHGAINDHGLSTVIENCIIRDNHADHEGGGLQIHSGAPTISNCTFLNNTSGGQGGGAWLGTDTDPTCSGPSTATFTNCVFDGNSAEHGGGMFQSRETAPVLAGCTFIRNNAAKAGGGVWFAVNAPTFTDCQFIDNSATEQGGGTYQGGIWVSGGGVASFDRCTWDGNTSIRGGAHYNVDNLADRILISDSVVRNNHATLGGGGFDMYSGAPFVTNTLFENNRAQYLGGGVSGNQNIFSGDFCDPGLCEAAYENCTFRGNSVYSYGPGGGGFYASVGSRPVLRGVVFEGNDSLVGGGGMGIDGFNDPQDTRINPAYLENCTFRRNSSTYDGGGLRIEGNRTATLVSCDFSENAAGAHGGGLYVYRDSRVTVFNSRFAGNYISVQPTVGKSGGALYATAEAGFPTPYLIIANTLFTDNASLNVGGAVALSACNAAIANSTFANNHCPGDGDALWTSGGATTMVNSIVWNNQEGTGSALSGPLTVSYSTVENGWPGVGNIAGDPLFLDSEGPDGLPGTDDDDWRLSLSSPALNAGNLAMLPADVADMDGDGDTSEPVPYDLNGDARIFGPGVDMGALETSIILCNPGTFSASGQQPCTPCSPGFAQPDSGATTCLSCDPGTFAASSGAAACADCPDGTFQPNSGATDCSPCACDDSNACTLDGCEAASGDCEFQEVCVVPAASTWGLTSLSLLLLIAGTLAISDSARHAAHAHLALKSHSG